MRLFLKRIQIRKCLPLLLVGYLGELATPTAHSQVIQLPTWRQFGVGTSVWIPDGGTVPLGGVTYGADYYGRRGPWRGSFLPGDVWRGSVRGSSQAYATATIIDHREWDEAVLAEARARKPVPTPIPPSIVEQRAERMRAHLKATREAKR